jgi:hypothetical protein
MKTDNEWHFGLAVLGTDKKIRVLDSKEDAEERIARGDFKPEEKVKGDPGSRYIRYVHYNWNKGQPIIDFGAFILNVVDIGPVGEDGTAQGFTV